MRFFVLFQAFFIFLGNKICMSANRNNSINAAIGLIHMHKAGGTTLVETLHHLTSPIPFVHAEFGSLDGSLLATLVNRTERKRRNIHVSFLMTLRNPIERLCSTAYYSYSLAESIFVPLLNKQCAGHNIEKPMFHRCNNKSKTCICFEKTWNEVINILKTDENVWKNWMNNSTSKCSSYIPNYHVGRMASYLNLNPDKSQTESVKKINEGGDKIKSSVLFQHLKNILNPLPIGFCNYIDLKHFNYTMIYLAKKLLKEQIDFLILEQSHTPVFKKALESAVFNTLQLDEVTQANQGIIQRHDHSNRCSDMMPSSIYTQMEKDNAIDFELYYYARNLFNLRAKQEGWNI